MCALSEPYFSGITRAYSFLGSGARIPPRNIHASRLGSRNAVPAVANGRQQTELLPYPMPEERSQRRRKNLRRWKLRGGRLEARKSETGSKPGGKDDLQTLPLKGLSR